MNVTEDIITLVGTTCCTSTDTISCFLLCWLLVVVNDFGTLFSFFFKQKSNQQKNELFLLDDFISMLRGCLLNKKLKLLYFLWICNLKYLKIIYCEVKRQDIFSYALLGKLVLPP